MFYNQPLAHRFGKALADDLESGKWQRAEMAVAWVRRSGMRHVAVPFGKFLKSGGAAQVTVGVDIENTSHEGLSDLLALQSAGSIETYIHHNEAEVVFHPKVYLLRNDAEARLIVGSNNLTEAGLFLNTEAGLQIDAPLADPVITEARTALAAWRDQALFKFQRVTRPEIRGVKVKTQKVAGTVLLMRVRRASESARRTQVQIPIRVVESKFFGGITHIVSAHDGRSHPLVQASARGSLNTIKLEIPEIEPMTDPVLRLERTANAIIYQAFDSVSVLGAPIRQALLNGFAMTPPATLQTPVDRSCATWWRFV